jgi:hypothetical protein
LTDVLLWCEHEGWTTGGGKGYGHILRINKIRIQRFQKNARGRLILLCGWDSMINNNGFWIA